MARQYRSMAEWHRCEPQDRPDEYYEAVEEMARERYERAQARKSARRYMDAEEGYYGPEPEEEEDGSDRPF